MNPNFQIFKGKLASLQALSQLGLVPSEAVTLIKAKAKVNLARIQG